MSERPSLAEALYGPTGPSTAIGTEHSRAGRADQAEPAEVAGDPADRPSIADALYPAPAPAAQAPQPEPAPAAPELRGEFDTIAGDLNLSPDESDRLLQLHDRALKAQATAHAATTAEWRRQAEATFTPSQLTDIRSRFDQALGTDATAVEFRRLLSWSGLGNHPATLKAISRLLRGHS